MTIDTPPIIQRLNDHVLTEHENVCVLSEVRNFNDFEAVSIQCPNCRIDRFAVHSYSQTQTDAQITKNISPTMTSVHLAEILTVEVSFTVGKNMPHGVLLCDSTHVICVKVHHNTSAS